MHRTYADLTAKVGLWAGALLVAFVPLSCGEEETTEVECGQLLQDFLDEAARQQSCSQDEDCVVVDIPHICGVTVVSTQADIDAVEVLRAELNEECNCERLGACNNACSAGPDDARACIDNQCVLTSQ